MKVILFGDSFSCDFNRINKCYVDWKKYEPKNFGQIISDELGVEMVNCANGGWDNYSIFHSIFNFIRNNKIDSDDIIIIGWTNILRYRVASIYDFWVPITPHTIYNFDEDRSTNISNNALFEFYNNRDNDLYYQEVNDFIDCVSIMFPNNIIINWTWDCENKLNTIPYIIFDTIYDETNGEIDDRHLNEKSAKKIADIMLEIINNKKIIIDIEVENIEVENIEVENIEVENKINDISSKKIKLI